MYASLPLLFRVKWSAVRPVFLRKVVCFLAPASCVKLSAVRPTFPRQVVAVKVLYISVLCKLSARFCVREFYDSAHCQAVSRHVLPHLIDPALFASAVLSMLLYKALHGRPFYAPGQGPGLRTNLSGSLSLRRWTAHNVNKDLEDRLSRHSPDTCHERLFCPCFRGSVHRHLKKVVHRIGLWRAKACSTCT